MLPNGGIVCVDGMVKDYEEIRQMTMDLRSIGCTMRTNIDPLKTIWKDRPAKPSGEIYPVDKSIIGEETTSKLQRLRKAMGACDAYVMTDLMEIAWTLNLRGSDVSMTPVFIAYLYITQDDACVFVNGPLTAEAKVMLDVAGVKVKEYDAFTTFLRKIADKGNIRILCSGKTTNYTIYSIVKENVKDADSPADMMKAIKNDAEIEGFRRSMLREGVAMVRFLRWLKPAVKEGNQTELSVAEKLLAFRKEGIPDADDASLSGMAFRSLSFTTICGYNEHGAIVHYAVSPETDKVLKSEGLLLLDSGAQYSDGTTDITRTIALGDVTDEMKHIYTLVLKAHIALASVPFPEGTNGTNLDTIPHAVLWRGYVDYMHGSGHGVGAYLSVHEGPQSMRQRWCPAPLKEGMTLTIEPGIYLEGKFGVRTENTMLVKRDRPQWLAFEPLTLCPIDTAPIEMSMLEQYEKDYLNEYHNLVREKLMPLLSNEDDKAWLIENTKKI